MENTFAQYLLSRSSITDIVGQKIYSYYLPQGTTYPAIVYRIVSGTHDHTLDSQSPALGIMRCRIQLDILSDKLDQVAVLSEAIRQELDGYSGSMSNAYCIRSRLVNELGFVTAPEDGSDTWVYRRAVDYLVRYKITVPSRGRAGAVAGATADVCSSQKQIVSGGVSASGTHT